MIVLWWALVGLAFAICLGPFLFFAWYCSTNGGEGYR